MKNQTDRLSLNSNFWFIVFGAFILVLIIWIQTGYTQESSKPIRPDWTYQTTFIKDGKIYFTGGFMNGADYSLSIRCANAEAVKVAAHSISIFIRSVFSVYVHGTNSDETGIDRYVEDGIATFVNNLHIQGLRQKQIYHEEVSNSGRPSYNVFVLLELSEADYKNAKIGVLESLRDDLDKVNQTEAKQKAERLLEELTEGV
jgi:hypothetical protein